MQDKVYPQDVVVGSCAGKVPHNLPKLLSEHRPISVEITESNLQYQGGIDFLEKPSF
jgi:hypothetical protein